MKKIFESILILIIFYGVYSVFDLISKHIFKDLKNIIVIMVSLVVSFLILLTYKLLISSSVKGNMKDHIDDLNTKIKKKEEEIKQAQNINGNSTLKNENSEYIK